MTQSNLQSFRYLITDMDGVLWRGHDPLPGLQEFVRFLRQRGIRLVCATNNASTPPEQLAERLQSWGTDITADEIVTSATATADYLAETLPAAARLYVIGMEGLRRALAAKGFQLAAEDDRAPVTAVVVGIDWQVAYPHFKRAALHIRAGARFFGTNGDVTFPSPEGIIPGNGALLALIEAATAVKPAIIGKPEPGLYQMALKRLQARPEQTLVLGDRMETDILGAARLGLKSALVLTGVTPREALPGFDYQPDWIFDDLPALTRHWADAHD